MKTFYVVLSLLLGFQAYSAEIFTKHSESDHQVMTPGIFDSAYSLIATEICYKGTTTNLCTDLSGAFAAKALELASNGAEESMKLEFCRYNRFKKQWEIKYSVNMHRLNQNEVAVGITKLLSVSKCEP